MKKPKRSQQKRITPQSRILRYMRMSRRISMRTAGSRIGMSDSAISHYEQGRMEIDSVRVEALLHLYGYTMEQFQEFVAGKPIPVLSIKDECVQLLDRIDEAKLRAVHAVLQGFVG